MIESIDQSLLLQYVEDELTPAEAEALRARLRDHPETLDALERLREDRLALRDVPEPEMPRDLVAELEPVLARPMLLEPNHDSAGNDLPGTYRRRQNRGMRRRRLVFGLLATAAGLVIVVGAGVVVTQAIKGLPGSGGSGSERQIASDRTTSPSPARLADAGPDGPRRVPGAPAVLGNVADPNAPIHHYAPVPIDAVAVAVGADSYQASRGGGQASRGGGQASHGGDADSASSVLPFTLVVTADPDASPDAALQSLQALVGEVDGRVTLVRNFSYEEAVAIAQEERRQRAPLGGGGRGGGGGGSTPPVVADSRNGGSRSVKTRADELAEIARFVVAQFERDGRQQRASSGVLAGRADLTPSFEEQLAISQRGATYTIAVPAMLLNDLLRVAHKAGLSTSLRLLPEEGASLEDQGWASDRPRIQRAVRDHTTRSPEHIVLLPIVVRERP